MSPSTTFKHFLNRTFEQPTPEPFLRTRTAKEPVSRAGPSRKAEKYFDGHIEAVQSCAKKGHTIL